MLCFVPSVSPFLDWQAVSKRIISMREQMANMGIHIDADLDTNRAKRGHVAMRGMALQIIPAIALGVVWGVLPCVASCPLLVWQDDAGNFKSSGAGSSGRQDTTTETAFVPYPYLIPLPHTMVSYPCIPFFAPLFHTRWG